MKFLTRSKSGSKSILDKSSPISPNLLPKSVKNKLKPSTNLLRTPKNFLSLFITPCASFIILGKFIIDQPIRTVPIKSSILPKNPFVVLLIILPPAFKAPVTPLASNKSSFCLLRLLSLLLANSLEDIAKPSLFVLFLFSTPSDICSDCF